MRARFAFAVLLLLVSMPAYADPPKLAIFDFELQDTSLEGEMRGPQSDERNRLILISDLVRRQVTDSSKFRLIDIAPVNAAIITNNGMKPRIWAARCCALETSTSSITIGDAIAGLTPRAIKRRLPICDA